MDTPDWLAVMALCRSQSGSLARLLRCSEDGGPAHDSCIDLMRSTRGLARGFSRYPGDIGSASCALISARNVFSPIRLDTVELDNRNLAVTCQDNDEVCPQPPWPPPSQLPPPPEPKPPHEPPYP